MKTPEEKGDPAQRWLKQEVRYSLRELLGEVADERQAGAFGAEKLRQADISQMFESPQIPWPPHLTPTFWPESAACAPSPTPAIWMPFR